MLVKDKFPHADLFTDSDLLQQVSTEGQFNKDNANRFVIYYDKTHVLCPDGEDAHYVSYGRKIGFHEKFDSSDLGSIVDITQGALFVVAISNSSADPPHMDGEFRFEFVDN